MMFDWYEFYKLSRELNGSTVTKANEEAKLRSAISRAYYATFCVARKHYLKKNPTAIPNSIKIHQDVQNWFLAQRSDKLSLDIGEHLQELHRYRKRADYDDRFDKLKSITSQAVDRANEALKQLTKLK